MSRTHAPTSQLHYMVSSSVAIWNRIISLYGSRCEMGTIFCA